MSVATNGVRLGCCAPLEMAALVREAGFGYIELPTATFLPAEDEAAFAPVKAQILRIGLPVHACNVFIPGTYKITGPTAEADRNAVSAYAATALRRLADVGVQVQVFGSGGARNIPEGFDRANALDQLAAFLTHVERESAAAGVAVVIEPLNLKESNVFTSVAESDKFNQERGLDGIYVLADLYHMAAEGESYAGMIAAGGRLRHAHVADVDRKPPGAGVVADYPGFFRTLRAIGYTGGVSVESRWTTDATDHTARAAEYAQAYQFMRQAWDASGT